MRVRGGCRVGALTVFSFIPRNSSIRSERETELIHNCRWTIDKCESSAERVGFEPTIPLPVYHLSRVASSTAPAPLQMQNSHILFCSEQRTPPTIDRPWAWAVRPVLRRLSRLRRDGGCAFGANRSCTSPDAKFTNSFWQRAKHPTKCAQLLTSKSLPASLPHERQSKILHREGSKGCHPWKTCSLLGCVQPSCVRGWRCSRRIVFGVSHSTTHRPYA